MTQLIEGGAVRSMRFATPCSVRNPEREINSTFSIIRL